MKRESRGQGERKKKKNNRVFCCLETLASLVTLLMWHCSIPLVFKYLPCICFREGAEYCLGDGRGGGLLHGRVHFLLCC